MNIQIESGVPLPPRNGYLGYRCQLRKAIEACNVGDSFLMDNYNKVRCAYTLAKYAGMKVATRKQEQGGWRIWRTK